MDGYNGTKPYERRASTVERNILDDNLTLSAYGCASGLEGREPTIGLVLGSGLNPLANEIADAARHPLRGGCRA